MNVLHISMERGIVDIRIDVGVGSCAEPRLKYGISHFLEHCMFKGTKKRGARELRRDAARIGGKLGAWTSFDHTVYHITALKEEFENAFELLADLFLNPDFPEKEIEKERIVVLDEIRRAEDRPSSFLHHLMAGKFWSHQIDHRILGSTESITSLTRDEIIQWRERYYSGKNIQLSVAGDITSEQLIEVFDRYYRGESEKAPIVYPDVAFIPGENVFYKQGIVATYLFLGYPALPRTHKNHIAQRVMTYLLGGFASSLLFERLREEMGLVYGVSAGILNTDAFNTLSIGTSAQSDDINLIEANIKKIIEDICSSKVSENQLVMAKASLLSTLRMLAESPIGINQIIAAPYIKGDSKDMYKRMSEEIPQVTREDILLVAEQTFREKPYIGRLWPKPVG
ncbi:MAG: pitrilysin family protein [Pseudomonadota bacterium]